MVVLKSCAVPLHINAILSMYSFAVFMSPPGGGEMDSAKKNSEPRLKISLSSLGEMYLQVASIS